MAKYSVSEKLVDRAKSHRHVPATKHQQQSRQPARADPRCLGYHLGSFFFHCFTFTHCWQSTDKMISAILRLTLLLSACYSSHAAAALSPMLDCRTVDVDGTSQVVCATYMAISPSPAELGNGTTIYLGPYSYEFTFYEGIENGTDVRTLENAAAFATNQTVMVLWEGETCQVALNNKDCSSCTLCSVADESSPTMSADCTNIDGGVSVDCQPAFIFYPLAAASSDTDAPTQAVTDDGNPTPAATDDGTTDGAEVEDTSGVLSSLVRGSVVIATLLATSIVF